MRARQFLAPIVAVVIATLPVRSSAQATAQPINLYGMGHDLGTADGTLYLIEFADFGCKSCRFFATEMFGRIDARYIKPGRVTLKFITYVTGNFPNSLEAAKAAECAAEQKAFWPMHDLLFARQREWMATSKIDALLDRYAKQLQLAPDAFTQCVASDTIHNRLIGYRELAAALYVRGTPWFFVNGKTIPGVPPFESFRAAIEAKKR